jgi:hypothetical protein
VNIRSVLVWHLGAVLFVGAAGAATYHGIRNLHAQRAALAERAASTVVADAAPVTGVTTLAPAVAGPAVTASARTVPAVTVPVGTASAPVRSVASALPVPPLPKMASAAHSVLTRPHRATRVAVSTRRRVYVAAPAAPEPPASYGYPGYLAYAPGAGYYPYYPQYRYYYGAY